MVLTRNDSTPESNRRKTRSKLTAPVITGVVTFPAVGLDALYTMKRINCIKIDGTVTDTVVVDDADYGWLRKYNWHSCCNGYVNRSAKVGKKWTSVSMHRDIMRPPQGMQVDHISGNRRDNRRCNLRICTPSENQHNVGKRYGKLKYQGTYKYSQGNTWGSRISANGVSHHLGSFRTQEEAARAYDRAAIKYHGEFAWVNFPTRLKNLRGQGEG